MPSNLLNFPKEGSYHLEKEERMITYSETKLKQFYFKIEMY